MYMHLHLVNNMLTKYERPSWPWSYGSWIYNYLCNQCPSPLMLWVRISIRARCITLCDKFCLRLATTGRWFSPVSSTNKTDRHEITEILLKVALSIIKPTSQPKDSIYFFNKAVSAHYLNIGNHIVHQWFSPCTPVSSTNKIDRHDITEILLKVALNTIKQTNKQNKQYKIRS